MDFSSYSVLQNDHSDVRQGIVEYSDSLWSRRVVLLLFLRRIWYLCDCVDVQSHSKGVLLYDGHQLHQLLHDYDYGCVTSRVGLMLVWLLHLLSALCHKSGVGAATEGVVVATK